ncbi:MAG: Holliday junction branch migration protein RuvA [Gammaproteobacteria bacterium]|nr:Holliday junction branch migration protein RuvA [Gammaproteobacteria bacterium]MCY4278631.1 Holliday junction branch migration protein RuvA [Gammaproteobacteria bacterium]
MIGHLRGEITLKCERTLVVDVAGVGYEVEVPARILDDIANVGSTQLLHTHLMVREDAQKLFGFIDVADRDAFRLLLRTDGVGPAMAMALLSQFTPAELAEHAHANNQTALSRVPGVGKKTAERLCFNLKDTLSPVSETATGRTSTASGDIGDSVARTLVQQLGFKDKEAKQLVTASVLPDMDYEQALQAALRASAGARA